MTDPLIAAARFLEAQLEWMRHAVADEQGQPYAVAAFAEIAHCAGRLRGLVNGPSEQRYLGPCGAPIRYDRCMAAASLSGSCVTMLEGFPRCDEGECVRMDRTECDGDVYGPRGGSRGRCRTCKAEVAQDDRQAWLDGEVRAHAFRAYEIAQAYGVSADTIRSWAARGRLKSYWRTDTGLTADWTDPPEGETRDRLHYIGDVLDLAAADKARLAGEQAKRARRAANRAADDERMSA